MKKNYSDMIKETLRLMADNRSREVVVDIQKEAKEYVQILGSNFLKFEKLFEQAIEEWIIQNLLRKMVTNKKELTIEVMHEEFLEMTDNDFLDGLLKKIKANVIKELDVRKD